MPYLLAGIHTHRSGSPPKPVKVFTLPFAFPSPSLALAGRRKMSAHRSLPARNRASIRGQPLRLKGDPRKWNARNWQVVRRPSRPKLSIGDCPGTRPSASRRQRSSYAAIAGAGTWLRASSNDAIAGAASASANATGQKRRRRGSIGSVSLLPIRGRTRTVRSLLIHTELNRSARSAYRPRPRSSTADS